MTRSLKRYGYRLALGLLGVCLVEWVLSRAEAQEVRPGQGAAAVATVGPNDPPNRAPYPGVADRLANPNVWSRGARDDTPALKAQLEGAKHNEVVRLGRREYILTDTVTIRAHSAVFDSDGGTVVIWWKGPPDRWAFVFEGCNETVFGTKGKILILCDQDFPLWGGVLLRNTKEARPIPMSSCIFNRVTVEAVRPGGLRFAALALDANGRPANNDLHTFNDFRGNAQAGGYAGFYSGQGNHESHQVRFIGGGFNGFRFGHFWEEGQFISREQNMGGNDVDFYVGSYHIANEIISVNSERSKRAIDGKAIPKGVGNLGGANLVVQTYRFGSFNALPDPVRWRSGAGILDLRNFQATHPIDKPAIFRSARPGGIVVDRLSERYGKVVEDAEVEPIKF